MQILPKTVTKWEFSRKIDIMKITLRRERILNMAITICRTGDAVRTLPQEGALAQRVSEGGKGPCPPCGHVTHGRTHRPAAECPPRGKWQNS